MNRKTVIKQKTNYLFEFHCKMDIKLNIYHRPQKSSTIYISEGYINRDEARNDPSEVDLFKYFFITCFSGKL